MTTELIKIEFYGQDIEAAEQGGEIWVGVKKLCDNLGIAAHRQVQKIQKERAFEGRWQLMLVPSGGGAQEALCINLDVLLLWLGSISTSKIKKSAQEQLTLYKRECMAALRKHFFGTMPTPEPLPVPVAPTQTALTPMQQMAAQAQMLATQAQAMLQLDERLCVIGQRLNQQRQQQQAAARELLALPAPQDLPQPRTLRSLLVERMRMVAETRHLDHRDCWNKLYREYSYRSGLDLKARAKNRGQRPLDVATGLGVVGKLYDLCCFLWPSEMGDITSNRSNDLPLQ